MCRMSPPCIRENCSPALASFLRDIWVGTRRDIWHHQLGPFDATSMRAGTWVHGGAVDSYMGMLQQRSDRDTTTRVYFLPADALDGIMDPNFERSSVPKWITAKLADAPAFAAVRSQEAQGCRQEARCR